MKTKLLIGSACVALSLAVVSLQLSKQTATALPITLSQIEALAKSENESYPGIPKLKQEFNMDYYCYVYENREGHVEKRSGVGCTTGGNRCTSYNPCD